MLQEIQDVTTVSGTKVGGLPPHPGQEREARAAGDTGQQRRPSQDSWGRPRATRGLFAPTSPGGGLQLGTSACCATAKRHAFISSSPVLGGSHELPEQRGSAIMRHTGFFFFFATAKPKGNFNNQLVHLVHRREDQEHD